MKLSQTEPLLWDQKMHYKIPVFFRRAARFKHKAREITTAKCVCVCARVCVCVCACAPVGARVRVWAFSKDVKPVLVSVI